MTLSEEKDDLLAALRIAQADRDKWKARAQKLAEIAGIKTSDIDVIDSTYKIYDECMTCENKDDVCTCSRMFERME